MQLVHPNGMTRPWVPWCGYSLLLLQSVLNLSIAESTVMDALESRSHHESTFNKFCTLSYELCIVDDGGKPPRCSRPSIGRGCDRRKDHEILLVKTRMVVWL